MTDDLSPVPLARHLPGVWDRLADGRRAANFVDGQVAAGAVSPGVLLLTSDASLVMVEGHYTTAGGGHVALILTHTRSATVPWDTMLVTRQWKRLTRGQLRDLAYLAAKDGARIAARVMAAGEQVAINRRTYDALAARGLAHTPNIDDVAALTDAGEAAYVAHREKGTA